MRPRQGDLAWWKRPAGIHPALSFPIFFPLFPPPFIEKRAFAALRSHLVWVSSPIRLLGDVPARHLLLPIK